MADSTTEAFLSGQGIAVEPARIESELIRLWGPAADRAGGPELDRPTVTRVVLANLVVQAGPGCPGSLESILDTVVERYPCRAIVVRMTGDPGRSVAAEVGAMCHLPAPGRPQVCSERIVLRGGAGAADLLPGAVRPLLEANLPVVLWWTGDPRDHPAVFRPLADESSRLILDLPDPAAEPPALRSGLDPDHPCARDTAWYGLTRWRELVARCFDGADPAAMLARLDRVEVRAEVAGSDARTPRIAAWLVAWLAGQLGWTPVERREVAPGRLEATFRGPTGLIRVVIATEATGRAELGPGMAGGAWLLGVTLAADGPDGGDTFHLARLHSGSPQVRVQVSSPTACALPRLVHSPTLDAAGRVTAALESSRVDPPFVRARPHALWLLGLG